MLVPNKIKEIEFTRAVRGYKDTEVDAFLNQISEDYAELYKENAELVRKLEILADKLEEYRSDEENMRLALVKIQKLAETKIKEANMKADLAIKSAEIKAERIILDAKKEVDKEKRAYEKMQFEATRFKQKLMHLYQSHMDMINKIPSVELPSNEVFSISASEAAAEDQPSKISVTPKNEVKEAFKIIDIQEVQPVEQETVVSVTASTATVTVQKEKPNAKEETVTNAIETDDDMKQYAPPSVTEKTDKKAKFTLNLFEAEDDNSNPEPTVSEKKDEPDQSASVDEHPKFGKIKFGADYDLDDEEDTGKRGWFSSRKK